MNNHTKHLEVHAQSLKTTAVQGELKLFLFKLGIKSAKPTMNFSQSLNDLFKQFMEQD